MHGATMKFSRRAIPRPAVAAFRDALQGQDLVLLDLPVVSEYYSRIFDEAGVVPQIAATATTVEMAHSLVGTGLGCRCCMCVRKRT